MEVPDITLLGRFRTPEDKFTFFTPKMGSKFSYPFIFRRQKRNLSNLQEKMKYQDT